MYSLLYAEMHTLHKDSLKQHKLNKMAKGKKAPKVEITQIWFSEKMQVVLGSRQAELIGKKKWWQQ